MACAESKFRMALKIETVKKNTSDVVNNTINYTQNLIDISKLINCNSISLLFDGPTYSKFFI